MAKISDGTYPAASAVVPSALHYVYDPTDSTHPDKTITETLMANIPSVVKGFADSVVITVGAEVSHVRAITVQAKDANGNNLTQTCRLSLVVYGQVGGTALASAPSTGLAVSSNGLILTQPVSKLIYDVKTDATGLLTMTWTDTTLVTAFLGVRLPDGRETISSNAMTNV